MYEMARSLQENIVFRATTENTGDHFLQRISSLSLSSLTSSILSSAPIFTSPLVVDPLIRFNFLTEEVFDMRNICVPFPLEDLMVEELCSTVPPKSVLLMLRRAAESKTMTQNMMRPCSEMIILQMLTMLLSEPKAALPP